MCLCMCICICICTKQYVVHAYVYIHKDRLYNINTNSCIVEKYVYDIYIYICVCPHPTQVQPTSSITSIYFFNISHFNFCQCEICAVPLPPSRWEHLAVDFSMRVSKISKARHPHGASHF